MDWWNLPTKIAAVLVALVTIGGFAWAWGTDTGLRPWFKFEQDEFTSKQFYAVMDQTQQNTRALVKGEFDELWGLRKFNELTWEQKMSLCANALILNYTVVDDQNRKICDTEKGTPILVFPSK